MSTFIPHIWARKLREAYNASLNTSALLWRPAAVRIDIKWFVPDIDVPPTKKQVAKQLGIGMVEAVYKKRKTETYLGDALWTFGLRDDDGPIYFLTEHAYLGEKQEDYVGRQWAIPIGSSDPVLPADLPTFIERLLIVESNAPIGVELAEELPINAVENWGVTVKINPEVRR